MSQSPQRLRVSNSSTPILHSTRYERHLSHYSGNARNTQDFFHIRARPETDLTTAVAPKEVSRPVSHRCESLPDNPYATGEADAADALTSVAYTALGPTDYSHPAEGIETRPGRDRNQVARRAGFSSR